MPFKKKKFVFCILYNFLHVIYLVSILFEIDYVMIE